MLYTIRRLNKPIHYQELPAKILERFPGELTKINTVHNELVKNNDLFINLGLGTYGLKERGFQGGSVRDILIRIFKKNNHPMTAKELTKEVLREKMVSLQREFSKSKNVILDGRDIGTVVFPEADIKIFLVADPRERAERRFKELKAKGENISLDSIYENILKRDKLDSTRENSPLKKANDAIEVDTTGKNIEEVKNIILNLYNNKG